MSELSNERKCELTAILADNLSVFRAKLNVTQEEFSRRVGITKTTLNHIENKKKEMTWVTFVAIMFLLIQNTETKPLVETFGLYPTELEDFLMFK